MTGPLTRVGTLLGTSALGAALAAIPATVRVCASDGAGCGASTIWLALAWVGLGPMLLTTLLFRGARGGIKAFAGPGQGSRAAGLALWALLELGVLSTFGSVLRATTHHHALAGVTFALGSLALSGFLALFSIRVAGMVSALPGPSRRAAIALSAAAIVMAVALVGRRFEHGGAGLGSAGATIVDLLAFFIAATFASRLEFADRRPLAVLGPFLVGAMLALGLSSSRQCPRLSEAARSAAPVYARGVSEWSTH